MLAPSHCSRGDIVAMDRAYINYRKFEELTGLGVTYVTKIQEELALEPREPTLFPYFFD